MDEDKAVLSGKSIQLVNEIAAISDYRDAVKKHYMNLARRLNLLTPMFEEIRDSKVSIPQDSIQALARLVKALESAKELLRFGSEGSKIYLVLEREHVMLKFQEVTAQLEQALISVSIETLDISDEVKEQAELVLAQFIRAKGRVDAPDVELHEDLLCLYNNVNHVAEDPDVLRRLIDKLQLCSVSDLTRESLALHEIVAATGENPEESIEKMSMLLKKIKDFAQTVNPNMDSTTTEPSVTSRSGEALLTDVNQNSLVIPDDFRCPISLELMQDPVIVSTGQTFERVFIEQWLRAGNMTCPKTRQTLTSTALTPNYVLRSLIAQWCETNGMEPPKRPTTTNTSSSCSLAEGVEIETLLHKLASANPEDQRCAAGEIRLLAKRNADNRVAIAEAGAVPLLVHLLLSSDSRTQEHAVTALLNLSICDTNKGGIISFGAVPGIVHVLKKGSMEARENAAATLFSLSVVDENKVRIGSSGAIPPLVTLLSEGTQRGKKDAATALFNLCIYQGNKGKAIRAGVIPTLMRLLTEPQGSMVDEALAILAILSSHPEGKAVIGDAGAVPVLVDVIGNGSPRNKENAAAVMVHLCSSVQQHLVEAQELGIMGPLLDMAQHGTERGRRKAAQLLELMNRYVDTHKQARTQVENHTQTSDSEPAKAASSIS